MKFTSTFKSALYYMIGCSNNDHLLTHVEIKSEKAAKCIAAKLTFSHFLSGFKQEHYGKMLFCFMCAMIVKPLVVCVLLIFNKSSHGISFYETHSILLYYNKRLYIKWFDGLASVKAW